MRSRSSVYVRFFVTFAVMGTIGLAASAYVLVMQRAPNPFGDTLTLKARFAEADGVTGGIGQPVNVAGVKVGRVTGIELVDGQAEVTMALQRDQVSDVYQDATAILEPITPLEDMQIALNPGRPPATPLADGATLSVDRTRPPVAIGELLSVLDADTRTYMASLITSVKQGTDGRAEDMRRALLALGPTAAQAGRISRALAARRVELARLVHNLAAVTRAASRDDELADVVAAGNTTLTAIAEQEQPLRQAISELPATLEATRSTLAKLEPFAAELRPTLTAVQPTLEGLPGTFEELGPFAALGARTLRDDLRPLVREARPVVRSAAPSIVDLDAATPDLTSAARTLNYFFNELAYNPPGDDEGFLFWSMWAGHNLNATFRVADAHGNIGRATRIVDCNGLQNEQRLQQVLGVAGLCPD